MNGPRFGYQPGLDGLRALAVSAVVAYHLGYPWAQGGFLGVDTFFVLSGFLITSLLLAEHSDTKTVSLRGFWSRRARRLLPAVFIMVGAVCLYAATNVPSIQLDTLRADAISSIFYVANWHFIAAKQSYFALFTNPLPLNHLWSLAIEEQFYLLWPLIVIGLLRLSHGHRRALVVSTIAGIIGSQIAMTLLYSPDNPSRAYYGTETRAHTILIGCLLAMVIRQWPDLPARAGIALQTLGVVALGACIAAFKLGGSGATYFHGGSLAFAVTAAIVICALIAPGPGLRSIFSIGPLRYLGRISYGIYLWHWPIIVFMTPERMGLNGTQLNLARVATTLAISAASFHLIEQPILHRRPKIAGARVLLPIGLTLVLASVFIGTAGATPPSTTLGRITGGPGRCGPAPTFETRAADRELRRLSPTPRTQHRTPRLAVFGDSEACSLLTGLEAQARVHHTTIADGAINGCGIVAGEVSLQFGMLSRAWARSCLRRVDHTIDQVLAHTHPRIVLWLSGWEVADLRSQGHEVVYGTPEHTRLLLNRMERLYRRIKAPGRKLVILTTPKQAAGKFFPAPDLAYNQRFDHLNAIFREFAAHHPRTISVIDLDRFVCPTGHPCSTERDGFRPRSADGIHFTARGAAWAAHWIWPQLPDPARTPLRESR